MKVKRIPQDELYHHGIKGQEWGVRNGPPYPIDHPVLRKGTKLNTVRAISSEGASIVHKSKNGEMAEGYKQAKGKRNEWLYTYNANNKYDNKVYKGPFAMYDTMRKGQNVVAEYKYEVIKDLKMPTKAQRVNEFKKLYKGKYKSAVVNDLQSVNKILIQQKIGDEKQQKNYEDIHNRLHELKTDDDWQTAYEIFNHAMEFSNYYTSTKEYSKRMSKKWDAMVDDNNQGTYNAAQDPIIIFRVNNSLKAIGNNIVPKNEVNSNYEYIKKELAKSGRRIKL